MIGQLIAGGIATVLTGLVVILVSFHPAAKTPGCSLVGCGTAILVAGLLPFLLAAGLATDQGWLVASAVVPPIAAMLTLVVAAVVKWPGILLYILMGIFAGAD